MKYVAMLLLALELKPILNTQQVFPLSSEMITFATRQVQKSFSSGSMTRIPSGTGRAVVQLTSAASSIHLRGFAKTCRTPPGRISSCATVRISIRETRRWPCSCLKSTSSEALYGMDYFKDSIKTSIICYLAYDSY